MTPKLVYFELRKEFLNLCEMAPRYPLSSADIYINYPQVLELTLSQSHLTGKNAAHFLQLKPFTQNIFLFHLTLITAGWTEAAWKNKEILISQILPKAYT